MAGRATQRKLESLGCRCSFVVRIKTSPYSVATVSSASVVRLRKWVTDAADGAAATLAQTGCQLLGARVHDY